MVHLSSVASPDSGSNQQKNQGVSQLRRQSTVPGFEHISLDPPNDDDFSSSVYGSRFAAQALPSHEMPEKEMPRDVAYRLIKDDLSLDGNPMLKYVRTTI